MRTTFVIRVDPLLQETSQVMLGERNHEVHTLALQRAQQALAEGIGLGSPGRCFQDTQPHVAHTPVEVLCEDCIPVMDEEVVAII